MPSHALAHSKSAPRWPVIAAVAAFALLLTLGLFFLGRPVNHASTPAAASPEAKAYLSNIALSDVSMQANENFMGQQVLEIQGKITNNGPRSLRSVEVFCLFYSTEGHEVYRERVPVVRSKGVPLRMGETRPFRLPFDNLPDGWNQALPKMVIAQIAFAE